MSGYNQDPRYGGQPETYWGDQTQQASSINFDMSGNNFGQELDFQTFDAQPPPEGSYTGAPLYGSNPYLNPSGGVSGYHGDIFTPPASSNAQPGFVEKGGEFEEEPPLLEDVKRGFVKEKKKKSKVNAVERRYLRNVCGKTRVYRVSNEWVLRECG
uniref:Uncharacterized protein n=1 Tax=Timema bartmani TaxID=61472 RepID=A0A7R9EV79_9NEOP|nr:unnamed protein product [Timema bartmani]